VHNQDLIGIAQHDGGWETDGISDDALARHAGARRAITVDDPRGACDTLIRDDGTLFAVLASHAAEPLTVKPALGCGGRGDSGSSFFRTVPRRAGLLLRADVPSRRCSPQADAIRRRVTPDLGW